MRTEVALILLAAALMPGVTTRAQQPSRESCRAISRGFGAIARARDRGVDQDEVIKEFTAMSKSGTAHEGWTPQVIEDMVTDIYADPRPANQIEAETRQKCNAGEPENGERQ